ncbi:hypothetical protein T190820D02B_10087 [Tenacibaculum sp. 190524A05c]
MSYKNKKMVLEYEFFKVSFAVFAVDFKQQSSFSGIYLF